MQVYHAAKFQSFKSRTFIKLEHEEVSIEQWQAISLYQSLRAAFVPFIWYLKIKSCHKILGTEKDC